MKYRWIAQDYDGAICKHKSIPPRMATFWGREREEYKCVAKGEKNENWRYSLIDRTTHDYKIEDGILIRLDKKPKTERHEYADVFIECAKDKSKVLQFKTKEYPTWRDSIAAKDEGIEWRVKPQD